MTFEEYLVRFRLLQHALEKDERTLGLMQKDSYRQFYSRFADSGEESLERLVVSEKALRERIARRERLCQRYALRLARAIDRIGVPELKEYAAFHYLYGLTHEEIAESSFYSVRTVYRHGKKAKKAMEAAMHEVGPKIGRIPSNRFRPAGRLRRKNYAVDRVSRSIATLTARQKSHPYRPVYA
jgi:hypothetical protein